MSNKKSANAVIADRTACIILTLFIVTATSRPLNKKSVCCQPPDPTITADLRPQSAHGTLSDGHRHGRPQPARPAMTVPCVIDDKRVDSQPESHRHLWRF